MAKKTSANVSKWLIVGLVVSVLLNLVVVGVVLYAVSRGPLELTAGNYFTAEALDDEAIEVDGKAYNCMRKELSPFDQGERLCYGAIVVDQNNQEVK